MDNIQWLAENGGAAIQLRLSALQTSNAADIETAVSALLAVDSIRKILDYYNGFKTADRDFKTLEHLIHSYRETCMETFFPYITDFGFRSDIAAFDDKMPPVADVFKYVYLMSNEQKFYNLSIMLHRYFFTTGYIFPELEESMGKRISVLHKAAKDKTLDIYEDESDGKLPKKPPIWTNHKVLKQDTNSWAIAAEKPLAMWFDIWALAYYADKCADSENSKKINDIIEYILNPEFQKILGDGYGLLYVKERRIYHVSSYGLLLPLYEIDGNLKNTNPNGMLDTLDFLSRFETVRKSKWFIGSLKYFEQFRTEKGTYILPKEYLRKKYTDKAFLNKKNMSLERSEREKMKCEVVSTMKMTEIYGRIK